MESQQSRSRRRSQRQITPSQPAPLVTEGGAVELAREKLQLSQLWQPILKILSSPWFLPFFISGATGVGAAIYIFSLPPVSECRNLSTGAADAEKLYCADVAARQGNIKALISALELVAQWPAEHPLHSQALELSNEWSQAMIVIARRQMEQGNQDYAKTLIQKVPKTSQYYAQAQDLLNTWTTDEGSTLIAQAETAIKAADWPAALDITRRLNLLGSEYWAGKSGELLVRLNYERGAWDKLEEARSWASWDAPPEYVKAIVLAQSIDPKTVAGQLVPQEVGAWVKAVIEYAQGLEASGDVAGAVNLITQIAPSLGNSQQNIPLLQLGQAEAAASQGTVWGYLEAVMRLEAIPREGILGEYVTQRQQAWELEAKNLGQLELAQWFASFDQGLGYQLAIQQAQTVGLGQPRRIAAQTLIAQWQRQAQASQEQPLLNVANQLAEKAEFEQAIEIANRIPMQASLYAMAQAQITEWRGELQRQLDQPILANARQLAKEKKLSEAIATARKISPSSPLYEEAQVDIRGWLRSQRQAEARETDSNPAWWSPSTSPTEPEVEPTPDTVEASPLPSNSPEATEAPMPTDSPTPTGETAPNPTTTPSPESTPTTAPPAATPSPELPPPAPASPPVEVPPPEPPPSPVLEPPPP